MKKSFLSRFIIIFSITLAGCNSIQTNQHDFNEKIEMALPKKPDPGEDPGPTPPPPPRPLSITGLSIKPNNILIARGLYRPLKIEYTMSSGTREMVNLSFSGLPSGVTVSYFPSSVIAPSLPVTHTWEAVLNISSTATPGNYTASFKVGNKLVPFQLQISSTLDYRMFPHSIVSSGFRHNLAINSDNKVVAWGNNGFGQLNLPTDVNVIDVAAGQAFSLALKSNGEIITAGDIDVIERNKPNNAVAIAVAPYNALAVALLNNGKVVAWGNPGISDPLFVPPDLKDVVAISASDYHVLALTKDGKVRSWGTMDWVPSGLANVVAISAGSNGYNAYSVALTADGDVITWEKLPEGISTSPIWYSSPIKMINSYNENRLLVTKDGKLESQGRKPCRKDVPTDLNDVITISGHDYSQLAVTKEGKLRVWGCDYYGILNVPSELIVRNPFNF